MKTHTTWYRPEGRVSTNAASTTSIVNTEYKQGFWGSNYTTNPADAVLELRVLEMHYCIASLPRSVLELVIYLRKVVLINTSL